MGMTAKDFRAEIDCVYTRLVELTASKGEEYKGAEDNQFGNFERGAADTGCTREQVLYVYLSKHMDGIKTYIRDQAQGKTRQRSEPITGRIDDAILYLVLLRAMVTSGPCADAEKFAAPMMVDPGITLVMAPTAADAIEQCRSRGLNVATRALVSVDQLHGNPPGSHILIIDRGTESDRHFADEIKRAAERKRMTHEVVHLQ